MLKQHDYVNMSLLDALHLARRMSGKSEDEVGAAMAWSPGNTARIFGADNYWPTLPNIPRLCVVMGNNILIDWLHAQAHAGGVQHDLPALDCPALMEDMAHMMTDLGEVAQEVRESVASNSIERGEAARIIKRLLKSCTTIVHTIRGLRPIVG